jgi:LEA14-like dessication related protein
MAIAMRFMSSPGRWLLLAVALILCGCAALATRDPPKVTVASIEPLDGDGLELRMLVRLRVVNPNDFAIDYDGVYLKLDVQGRTIATGVSDEKGSVPRFGESIVPVRVTLSLVDVARHALRMFNRREGPPEELRYRLEGKLGSPLFGATRFETEGDLRLPRELMGSDSIKPNSGT